MKILGWAVLLFIIGCQKKQTVFERIVVTDSIGFGMYRACDLKTCLYCKNTTDSEWQAKEKCTAQLYEN